MYLTSTIKTRAREKNKRERAKNRINDDERERRNAARQVHVFRRGRNCVLMGDRYRIEAHSKFSCYYYPLCGVLLLLFPFLYPVILTCSRIPYQTAVSPFQTLFCQKKILIYSRLFSLEKLDFSRRIPSVRHNFDRQIEYIPQGLYCSLSLKSFL